MHSITKYTLLIVAAFMSLQLFAQQPIFIVNGERVASIDSIPQSLIERYEELEVTDSLIAEYGTEASNGVVLLTVKYDQNPKFLAESSFSDYIIDRIKWDKNNPTARIVVKYRILTSGELEIVEVLDSTEWRLKRKVLKVMEESPVWQPALRGDTPVESEGILTIQLPLGRSMPREKYIIIL